MFRNLVNLTHSAIKKIMVGYHLVWQCYLIAHDERNMSIKYTYIIFIVFSKNVFLSSFSTKECHFLQMYYSLSLYVWPLIEHISYELMQSFQIIRHL